MDVWVLVLVLTNCSVGLITAPLFHSAATRGGKLIASLFVSLRSDSSDPESDDGDDQAARDAVSSLQRRASLAALKEGREPEEHSPELCGLGVGRGLTTHDAALGPVCDLPLSGLEAGNLRY